MPTMQTSDANPVQSPVFILTTSRSGSTLLRFLLDSHPEFACAPEAGVSAALAQLARVWNTLEDTRSGEHRPPMAPPALSPRAATAVRAAIDDAYRDYLRARGKARWCDKSLETFQHADIVFQTYPDAKFIVLTRHCMDVIASGVEICPWGVSRFGFDPYVAQYPGNSVAAIGSYWLACTKANLSFAEQHPESCHRVRYEDLVTVPEETTASIFEFLGAAPAPGIAKSAFTTPHDATGPGDEKIWFTSGVSGDSLGRGINVPAAALPQPLRQSINETLAMLNYRSVGDDWNAATGPLDPRTDAPASPGSTAIPGKNASGRDSEVKRVARAIATRIAARDKADLDAITVYWPTVAGTRVRIVVQGSDGDYEEIPSGFPGAPDRVGNGRNGARSAGDGEVEGQLPAVIASPAIWRSLLDGRSNFVTEVAASRLRCVSPRDGFRLRSDEIHATAALLGLATIPVRTPAMLAEQDARPARSVVR